eukprot:TRINITY_DN98959_c0_g1_i1.p1 TRINITY_DN98959_c0_g1~~TRINITY_DN98959_c0_g1_i1.p1  ORF type:complete len:152 (+),score=12.10 TRINITY_DN98959_c0_g1_i1:72-527(+)
MMSIASRLLIFAALFCFAALAKDCSSTWAKEGDLCIGKECAPGHCCSRSDLKCPSGMGPGHRLPCCMPGNCKPSRYACSGKKEPGAQCKSSTTDDSYPFCDFSECNGSGLCNGQCKGTCAQDLDCGPQVGGGSCMCSVGSCIAASNISLVV